MIAGPGFALDDAFPGTLLDEEEEPPSAIASRIRDFGGDLTLFWLALDAGKAIPGSDAVNDHDRVAVAAWRSGIPEFRRDALSRVGRAIAENSSAAAVFTAILGLPRPTDLPEFLRGQADDPFSWPRPLRQIGRVGGYRGLGGQFMRAPTALSAGRDVGLVQVRCGEETWSVRADIFGATVLPVDDAPADTDTQMYWGTRILLSSSVEATIYPTSYLVWLERRQP